MTTSAINFDGVGKTFQRTGKPKEHSTVKTELVRWLTGRKKQKVVSNDAFTALRNVSFSIPLGKTVGIIGHNGSGKSTLLKLITGIYRPTEGQLTVNGRVSALLELGAGFHPDFTGRENVLINGIILGMTRAELKDRLEAILAFAELGDFIDEPVRTYSSGMFMRLAFSVAIHVNPDILVIDEILAVGDESFQKKSYARMMEFKNSGRTIVLVTHVLETVEKWCDLAVWLDHGTVRAIGDPREVVQQYKAQVAGVAPPPPPAHLGLRLMQNGVEVGAAIHSGSPLEIATEIGAEDTAGAKMLIELKSADVAIASFSRELSAAPIPTLVLPSIPFASGTYRVVAAVHRATGEVHSKELPLLVEAPSTGPGVVHLSHEWR